MTTVVPCYGLNRDPGEFPEAPDHTKHAAFGTERFDGHWFCSTCFELLRSALLGSATELLQKQHPS